MSSQIFNPDEWKSSPSGSLSSGESRGEAPVDALVQAIEASGIDITPSYSEWLTIAFALVSELGEEGRDLFHRISRLSPRYEYQETDHQYTACLHDGSRQITIGSLFHIAKQYGISVIARSAATKQPTCTVVIVPTQ